MSTRIGEALRDLGDAVEEIEAGGGTVTAVEPSGDGLYADGTVSIELGIRLPFLPGDAVEGTEIALEGASIGDDGSLLVDLIASRAAGGRPPPDTMDVDESDGLQGRNDAEEPIGADGGNDPDDETGPGPDGETAVPAYRDPERLRAVYDAHDTFRSMTEALGVDVTPQTVRRHMIEQGIHEPGTGTGGSDQDEGGTDGDDRLDARSGGPENGTGAAEKRSEGSTTATGATGATGTSSESGDTDGSATDGDRSIDEGVPPEFGDVDGVTIDELKEAVRTSRTIHEVARRLDVPRERAFRILNTLDLIDLVSGRLETAERTVSAEELDQRIARATAAGE